MSRLDARAVVRNRSRRGIGSDGGPGKRRASRGPERWRNGLSLLAFLPFFSCSSAARRGGLFQGEERVLVVDKPAQRDQADLLGGRGGLGGERSVCRCFGGRGQR